MRTYRAALSFMVTVFCSVQLYPQTQTHVDHITERDGLSYRWVLDITQDHRGFMWFATYDGLNRYDGQDFITYKHSDSDTNSLSSGKVHHVTEDARGGIWTYGEDLIFNRLDLASGVITQTNTYHRDGVISQGLNSNMIHFAPLANGDFIALRQEKMRGHCSFWKYSPEGNYFEHLLDIPTNTASVNYFSECKDGRIWLWGMGIGYYLVDLTHGKFEYFPVDNIDMALPSGVAPPIDHNKDLWYPTDIAGGPQTLRRFPLPRDMDVTEITAVRHDNTGDLWINYGDSTLYRFDVEAASLEVFHDPFFDRSADLNSMRRFYIDQEGACWSGHFHGAARIENRPQLFSSYVLNATPGSEQTSQRLSARDMVQYGPDKIIVRNQSYELFIIDVRTNQIRILTRSPVSSDIAEPPSGIKSMLLGRDGFLWTNQGDKLVKTNPATGRFRVFDGPKYREGEHARIFQDKAGKVWWCSPRSIFHIDTNDLAAVDLDLAPGLDFMYASYDPLEDKIYGMYERGIYRIDCRNLSATRLEIFGANERDFMTTAILYWQDSYWLSTDKGLVRYHPATRERTIYARKDGLPSDIIYSALGAETDLWLGTHNGLCQFDPEKKKVAIYYQEQGLPHNEFNRWSYLEADDGRMYFGGLNGIVGFDPDDFAAPEGQSGHLNLVDFSKYSQKRDEVITVESGPYTLPDIIRISPYERTLSFRYVLARFQDVTKNQYFHYLDGMEQDWVNNGNQNEARYIQVPPGEYTFRVKALGPDGMQAMNELAIPIGVQQYWYLRWWAILGYAAIAGCGVVILYRFQLSRRLDRQEAERIRELEEVKSRMYTNITHEFRTPLTVMLGMNEKVQEYAAEGELGKVQQSTEMIERNARNLLNLVNQMLDLSKLESGMLDVHNEHADILSYLRYRIEAFQSYAAEKEIDIDLKSEEREILMDFDPDRISHIVNNLVSNAIKFTPQKGQIFISAAVMAQGDQRFLEFKVRDTGIGIEPDKITHIFDRFYQADSVPLRKHEGTGIGLSLVHEMVRLLGGSIAVQSEPGRGAEFTVLLPITDRSARRATESVTSTPGYGEKPDITGATLFDTQEREEMPLVLIVEDNADVMHYIGISIDHAYRTITATDGEEGIAKAIEHIPDVIISDVMMPGTDGYQLCEVVKKDERTSHIPVILLTAKTDHDSKVEGLEHGADVYLSKPFDKKELLVRLRNLLALRAEMQRRYAQTDYTQSEISSSDPQDAFIRKVRSCIAEHLEHEEFDVSTLSRLVHVSRAQLHRKLTAVTGHSTTHLIRKVQLEKAKSLLLEQDLTVSEVAYRTGFKTQAHFSRVFSDAMGTAPSAYRKKRRETGP